MNKNKFIIPLMLLLMLIVPLASSLDTSKVTHYYNYEDSGDLFGDVVGSVDQINDGTTNVSGYNSTYGSARYCDGANDKINSTDLTAETTKGLSYWFYTFLNSDYGVGNDRVITSIDSNAGVSDWFAHSLYGSAEQIIIVASEWSGTKWTLGYSSWHHIVITCDGTTTRWYEDGESIQNLTNPWCDFTGSGPGGSDMLWCENERDAVFAKIYLDEIVFYDDTITHDEVKEIYSHPMSQYLGPPGESLTVIAESPVNADHTNDDPVVFVWNVTSSTNSANCTTYLNSTAIATNTSLTNGTYEVSLTLNETEYEWYVACEVGAVQDATENRTVVYDAVKPDITVHASNFFSTNNGTVLNKNILSANQQFNLTFDDNYLWGYNVTISNGSNVRFYSIIETNLSVETFNFPNSVYVLNWTAGEYTAKISVEDDHTASWWQADDIRTGPQYLTVDTPEGNTITISNEQGNLRSVIYEQLDDRVTFGFKPNNNRPAWVFRLSCSSELYYRMGLWDNPTFVCSSGFGRSNWVDFLSNNTIDTMVLKDGDDYLITVTKENNNDPIIFRSIGGLNTKTEWYTFNISDITPQVTEAKATAASSDWISMSWTTTNYTNHTEVWREGSWILNSTTTSYNDTGLSSGSAYNYVFYAVTDSGWKNTSVSSANNFTNSTIFNTTVYITVKDSVTSALLTNVNVVLTGTLNYNLSVNGTTLYSNTIIPGNYTIRATKADYAVFAGDLEVVDSVVANLTILMSPDGTITTFYVKDSYDREIIGAAVNVVVKSTGSGLGIKTTDLAGTVGYVLDSSTTYTVNITATGFSAYSKDLTPILYTYNIYLQQDILKITSKYQGITSVFTPHNASLANGTSHTFGVVVNSTYWNLSTCTFTLYNTSNLAVLNTTTKSCSNNDSLALSLVIDSNTTISNVYAEVVLLIDGENIQFRKFYSIRDLTIGRFTIMQLITDLVAFSKSGFNNFTRSLIGIALIFGLVGFSAKNTDWLGDPDRILLLIAALVALLSYAQFFRLDFIPTVMNPTVTEFMRQYGIALLVGLLAVSRSLSNWEVSQ